MRGTPNPFFMQKYFGQWIITNKNEPARLRHVLVNVSFMLSYVALFAYSIQTENAFIPARYNFISSMRFYVQTFLASFLLVQLCLTTSVFCKHYARIFNLLHAHDAKLAQIGIKTAYNLHRKRLIFVAFFAASAIMFAIDWNTFYERYESTYFICQYLPCLVIGVYVVSTSTLLEMCGYKFAAINDYLQQFTCRGQRLIDKYYVNKRHENPKPLLDVFPNEESTGMTTIYQMLFNIFDDYIDHVRLLNTICGGDLLIVMIIITVDVLSLVYDICMDVGLYAKGKELAPRYIYSIEYWPVMSLFGLVILLNASSGLMEKANSTKFYLHQVINLYPKLNKYAESFSLQMMHSTLEITAARFVTIHWGIIYKLVSAWITYIIIFMQLDTDISST